MVIDVAESRTAHRTGWHLEVGMVRNDRRLSLSGRPRRRRAPVALQVLLAALALTAFLTGTKLLPTKHNVGLFEVITGLMLVYFTAYALTRGLKPRFHVVSVLALVLLLVATTTILNVPAPLFQQAILDLAVLTFLVLLLLVLHNIGLAFLGEFPTFLRAVSWAGVVVGAWVVFDSARAGWSVTAFGPFRNRAHMGIYLLTVFWIILLAVAWPGQARVQRVALALSLPLVLYGIAASGRRSVYLSLFIGLAALATILWAAGRRRRAVVASVLVVSALFLVGLLVIGKDVPEQTGFFRTRVVEVVPRLRAALSPEVEGGEAADMFFFQQRTGALQAFLDNPLMGIGFGGFAGSGYPGSLFEVHSTPLRFLAETGLVGITAYATFMAALLFGAARLARKAWHTPFRSVALVLTVAWWSLAISYGYNRHITERTFWLLLAIFLVFDAYLARWIQATNYVLASRRLGVSSAAAGGGLRGNGRAAAKRQA